MQKSLFSFHFSGPEVLFTAEQQLEAANGVADTSFVTIKLSIDENSQIIVEAYQVYSVCFYDDNDDDHDDDNDDDSDDDSDDDNDDDDDSDDSNDDDSDDSDDDDSDDDDDDDK